MKKVSFRNRWGLPEESYDERFQKLISRIVVVIGDLVEVSNNDLKSLALVLGVPVGVYGQISNYLSHNYYFKAGKYFSEIKEAHELAKKIEDLFKTDILDDQEKKVIVKMVETANIGVRIAKTKDGGHITYPQGESMLDKEVVERVLKSLSGKSLVEYTKSLRACSLGSWNEASNCTRRALEEYLRQYLGNDAGLSANIQTIGRNLKDKKVANHFRNSIICQLKALDDQYNSGSKHGSKTQGIVEAEYLIYSVGVVINTLEQLKTT